MFYNYEIGRFVNEDPIRDGDNWYNYCGSDPVNHIDPTGYARKKTIYYFYGSDQEKGAYRNIKILRVKYNVIKTKATSRKKLKKAWNNMSNDTIYAVIINVHGSPDHLYLEDDGRKPLGLSKYKIKTIDTLLLLSCNAGHLDYWDSNPAYQLWNRHNIRQLVACDGTHQRGLVNITSISVLESDKFKEYCKEPRSSRGFVRYYKKDNGSLAIEWMKSSYNSVYTLLRAVGK